MATTERYPSFKHEPLDITRRSIRLISIEPRFSAEGLIQCTIHHTTIDAHYNCLSYMWGPSDPQYTILVNGKRLTVNRNLFDFILEIRTLKYREPGRWYKHHLRSNFWIDAVCIDQSSSVEKNHQVAQMGKIFSNARKVIMWLGHGDNRPLIFDSRIPCHYEFIMRNQYWTRAWILQEIVLAKDPIMMVKDDLIPLPKWIEYLQQQRPRDRAYLPKLFHAPNPRHDETDDTTAPYMVREWRRAKDGQAMSARKLSLLHWLEIAQNAECKFRHDRVFSVLELAEEGSKIKVDHDMPLVELAYCVLVASGPRLCLCEIYLVNHVLGTWARIVDHSIFCEYAEWDFSGSTSNCPISVEAEKHVLHHRWRIEDELRRSIVRVPFHNLCSSWWSRPVTRCEGAKRGEPSTPATIGRGVVPYGLVKIRKQIKDTASNFEQAGNKGSTGPLKKEEKPVLPHSNSTEAKKMPNATSTITDPASKRPTN